MNNPEDKRLIVALYARANALRDALCAILSSTGAYPHDIPRLAKAALERDNESLDEIAEISK